MGGQPREKAPAAQHVSTRERACEHVKALTDIRGILHAHTDQSDGGNTLEEMAEATRKRGYQYFGVADHSQSARYAGRLSLEQIEQQHADIDWLNADFDGGFRIFKGIESDILPDGSLDYPDDILRRFDFLVASIHGQFRMDREQQTERLFNADSRPRDSDLSPSNATASGAARMKKI
jgi:DNA polymerase (family X)